MGPLGAADEIASQNGFPDRRATGEAKARLKAVVLRSVCVKLVD